MAESSQIYFDLIGRDKYSKEFKKAGVALAGIGLAVGEFAKQSVEAYKEAETAQASLNAAYAKFSKVHDVTLSSLNDLSQATQKKTTFDHEQVQSAEAVLATFNLTGKQIEALIPLIADYAGKTGKDLVTASDDVGKAFLGNTKALKEIGIKFKATGDTAKDFATIQEDLNAKVGGFESGQSGTAAFKAAQLKNEYHDLQEQVGSALVPALSALASAVTPVLAAFNELPKPIKDVTLFLTAAGVTALVVVPRIAALKVGLAELGVTSAATATEIEAVTVAETEAGAAAGGAAVKTGLAARGLGLLKFAASPAGLLIGAAAIAIKLYGDNAEQAAARSKLFADALQADGGVIGEHTKKAAADALAIGDLGRAYREAGIYIPTITKGITGSPRDAAAAITAINNAKVGSGAGSVGAGRGSIAQFAQNSKLLGGLKANRDALAALHPVADTVATSMGNLADRGSEAALASDALAKSLAPVSPPLADIAKYALQAESNLFSLFTTQLGSKQSRLQFKDSLQALTDGIKTNGKTLDENTSKGRANQEALLGQVQASIKAYGDNINLGDSIEHATSNYQAQIKAIEKAGIAGGLTKKQVDGLIGAYDKIPPEVQTLIDAKNIDAALRKAQALLAIEQQLGVAKVGSSGKQGQSQNGRPTAPPTATGGIVFGPQIRLVGEAGPEAIVPLSKAGGLGGHMTVNITVTSADPQDVVRAIQKYQRANGKGWAA